MVGDFHKFPHTPHLLWLGRGVPRADKVLKRGEVEAFLSGTVIIEEKVDGANLGLSLGPDARVRAQSRGHYLVPGRSHAQWHPLWAWIERHRSALEAGLRGELILYGEWCYARHTIPYELLPDWFLGFDVFDLDSQRFWEVDRRNAWLREHGLVSIPEIRRGRLSSNQVPALLGASAFGHAPMEGLYLRREGDGFLQMRAKVVSPAFKQQIVEHWTRRPVVPNKLASKIP